MVGKRISWDVGYARKWRWKLDSLSCCMLPATTRGKLFKFLSSGPPVWSQPRINFVSPCTYSGEFPPLSSPLYWCCSRMAFVWSRHWRRKLDSTQLHEPMHTPSQYELSTPAFPTPVPHSAHPPTTTMTSRPLTTALLLPPSPHTSIASTLSFWTAPLTSALSRPLTLPTLLYIGVSPPFPTSPRRTTFAPAQRLLTGLYSLFHRLSPSSTTTPTIDVRFVLLSPEEDAEATFGPVMSTDQLAELQEWDVLLVPRVKPGTSCRARSWPPRGVQGCMCTTLTQGCAQRRRRRMRSLRT